MIAVVLLGLFAASADAQVVRWAGEVDVERPGVLHAPDAAVSPVDPPLTLSRFGSGFRYAGLAQLLGVSPHVLANADVIAFEGNGGHGAGVNNGWESSVWTFSDPTHTYVARYRETQPVGGPGNDPAVVATGSITAAAYRAFFGMCPPTSGDPDAVISFILFNLRSVRPGLDTHHPSFSIRIENFTTDGEGTPDPDAVGILSTCDCSEAP